MGEWVQRWVSASVPPLSPTPADWGVRRQLRLKEANTHTNIQAPTPAAAALTAPRSSSPASAAITTAPPPLLSRSMWRGGRRGRTPIRTMWPMQASFLIVEEKIRMVDREEVQACMQACVDMRCTHTWNEERGLPSPSSLHSFNSRPSTHTSTQTKHKGTVVTRGKALGVVLATGGHTTLGRIFGRATKTKPPKTELQVRAFTHVYVCVWTCMCICVMGVLCLVCLYMHMCMCGRVCVWVFAASDLGSGGSVKGPTKLAGGCVFRFCVDEVVHLKGDC